MVMVKNINYGYKIFFFYFTLKEILLPYPLYFVFKNEM